jgi:hypothetical protein
LWQLLRALGHDALTVQEAGNAGDGIPDPEVLAFAVKQRSGGYDAKSICISFGLAQLDSQTTLVLSFVPDDRNRRKVGNTH